MNEVLTQFLLHNYADPRYRNVCSYTTYFMCDIVIHVCSLSSCPVSVLLRAYLASLVLWVCEGVL